MTAEADGFVIVKVPRSRLNLAWMSIVPSGPSPAAIDAARKAFSETGEYAHAVSAEQFRMALALKAALYAAYRVDRGASAPPAGPQ